MDSTHHKAGEHNDPLLHDDGRDSSDIELARLDDSLDFHSRPEADLIHDTSHPVTVKKNVKSYLAIAGALVLTVAGFTVNTEATAYCEDILGYKKPFMIMYFTHSALALPWVFTLAYSRWTHRETPYKAWVRDYNNKLRELITTVDAYATTGPLIIFKRKGNVGGPLDFLATTMFIVFLVLTASGCSWFLSLVLTTPADLTAIYNCSTFFAAVFSVPILHEKLGWLSIIAVALSIAGTFIIAYGDTTAEHDEETAIGGSRLLGNLIACIGAVAFGLYEVLFKKWASSSRSMEPAASLPLTFAASALTGIYTFSTIWLLLLVLHFTGIEPIVIPSLHVFGWLVVAVIAGSIAIQLLVVIVVWTDPVFGSMANVLSVFAVAVADYFVFGLRPSAATYIGGALIIVAFAMLAKGTLGEAKH